MSATLTVAGYALLALVAVGLELWARRGGGVASLGQVLAVVTGRRPGRALLLVGWLWLGWHLFVRVHWR